MNFFEINSSSIEHNGFSLVFGAHKLFQGKDTSTSSFVWYCRRWQHGTVRTVWMDIFFIIGLSKDNPQMCYCNLVESTILTNSSCQQSKPARKKNKPHSPFLVREPQGASPRPTYTNFWKWRGKNAITGIVSIRKKYVYIYI